KLDEPEQQMLGTHIIVVETVGLFTGQGQHLLGAGSEVVHDFFFSPSSVLPRESAFILGSGTCLSFSRNRSERKPSRSSVLSFRSKSFCRCAGWVRINSSSIVARFSSGIRPRSTPSRSIESR